MDCNDSVTDILSTLQKREKHIQEIKAKIENELKPSQDEICINIKITR